jgi:hypothetical protein
MTNMLTLEFVSNGAVTASGFRLQAEEVTAGCGGNLHGMVGCDIWLSFILLPEEVFRLTFKGVFSLIFRWSSVLYSGSLQTYIHEVFWWFSDLCVFRWSSDFYSGGLQAYIQVIRWFSGLNSGDLQHYTYSGGLKAFIQIITRLIFRWPSCLHSGGLKAYIHMVFRIIFSGFQTYIQVAFKFIFR